MPNHLDVDIPSSLQSSTGSLLAAFQEFLASKGFTCERKPKPPGGHITPWWLYVALDANAPSKSRLQFGETVHAAVNPTSHLWVRGKDPYLAKGHQLLKEFIHLHDPNSGPGLAAFDGSEYGGDYLVFARGDVILTLPVPYPYLEADLQGWAYGRDVEGVEGWYPAAYVRHN